LKILGNLQNLAEKILSDSSQQKHIRSTEAKQPAAPLNKFDAAINLPVAAGQINR
jgi:hypothetical protein